MIELHTGREPTRPHRALVTTILLLALTCGLAIGMVCRRSGATLGLRHAPSGWEISFQPPRSFEPAGVFGDSSDSAILFSSLAAPGARSTLVVRRMEIEPGVSPNDVARYVSEDYTSRRPREPRWPGPVRSITELGPHEAIEIINQQRAFVVRATVLRSGHALAFSLSTERPPISSRLYRMFNRTCRSVEYE